MKKSRDGKRDQHNLDCTTRKLCFDPIFIDFHHYLNIPKLPILSGFFLRQPWGLGTIVRCQRTHLHLSCFVGKWGLISVKTGHFEEGKGWRSSEFWVFPLNVQTKRKVMGDEQQHCRMGQHHWDWVKTRVAMSSPCGKLYNDPLEVQNPKWIQMVKWYMVYRCL